MTSLKFSERYGFENIKTELEKGGLSKELQNHLWSAFYLDMENLMIKERENIYISIWMFVLEMPIDEMPKHYDSIREYEVKEIIKDWFYGTEWYNSLNFIEHHGKVSEKFRGVCNMFFKQKMSAYRFVDDLIVEINSEDEIVELENAFKIDGKYSSSKKHLKKALKFLSDKENPDYPNSIKESISAVESMAKIITGDESGTLGVLLKTLERKHSLAPTLKAAFSKLYGYTSDVGGIRHGLKDDGIEIGFEEARFMLVTCTSFVNYLAYKL